MKIVVRVSAVLAALLAIIPFYILILLAMKSPEGGLGAIRLIPDFHLQNFSQAWEDSNLGQAILNSGVITVISICCVVALASMAGFSIARVPTLFNRLVLLGFLFSMMIPGIINTVPLYSLLIGLKGINTYWGMICVLTTNALPFSVFLYSSFIRTMPKSLEESAEMDGCSPWRAFWSITFPLLRPVTASVVILQGLGMWNNYAQAVFFLQSRSMRTIPLSISLFFQQYGANWPVMAAAALIGLSPAVLAFLVFQRQFISGISTGAIKE